MGKEELKNKISMSLKDPVLQIGFEIICKNLSELERENAELKEDIENLEGIKLSQGSALETEYMINESLKEENAVLKKWKEDTIKARGNDYMTWSRQNDQLTKAKELIEDMYYQIPSSQFDYYKDVMERARQFLKEE